MDIRKLEIRDIEPMVRWMNDLRVSKYFTFSGKCFTYADGEKFILNQNEDKDIHRAIVDEDDNYIGTVSIKNIDKNVGSGEYAIALAHEAQGRGYGKNATKAILEYTFDVIGLNRVYLNVLSDNYKAIAMYETLGFAFEGEFKKHTWINGEARDLSWFAITKSSFTKRKIQKDFKMLDFNEFGDERGKLVAVEAMKEIPFDIKRIFYIYGAKNESIRGKHANRASEFVLINLNGSSKVRIDNGKEKTVIYLERPNQGLYINKMVWKEMYDFSKDSVLLVISNKPYDKNEYISDYDDYIGEVNKS